MIITLDVQNLKCQGCANTITTKLSNLEGIEDVLVTTESPSVSFHYENENILAEAKNLLYTIGYPVLEIKTH